MSGLLTLAESVAAHARAQPNKIGLRDSKRALTYAQWNARATRLANGLLGLGLSKGDRVALLAYNTSEWMEIYVALARAGLVAVPINFRLMGPEISYIVQHSEARAFIVQESLRAVVEGIRAELPIEGARYVHFGAEVTPLGWHGYEALIAAAIATAPTTEVAPEDLFALMYTSGTTGRPKGAMRSHEGNALLAFATALEFGLTRDDNGLLVMPLCHANSLYFSVTFAMLGATIVIDDRSHFDPEALLGLLARERITFTSLVPTHYVMMLDLPAEVKARHDLSRVGKLLVSSAPARQETKRAILKLFPNGRLFELYGSTEAGWVTVLRPDEQIAKLGSVGREWAGSGAIKMLDADGCEVPDGEVGELYSRTPYVFSGYWKNTEKTVQAFSGAWCSVGDMARRDADGFIHLVDRKSNMIISGGENIYPSEVEAVLAAHPTVQDVAVIGVPDPKWGEAVHAVIVTRPGFQPSERELLDWCRERIAGYKRPRAVQFIGESEMPRTATGKIQHRLLRDRISTQRLLKETIMPDSLNRESIYQPEQADLKFPEIPSFSTPAAERRHRQERLVAACRAFALHGLDYGFAGHLTVRDPERPHLYWTNPMAVHFSQVKLSNLILADHSGHVVEGEYAINRAGFVLHAAVHEQHPDIVAMCHAHTVYGVAYASLGRLLPPITQDAAVFFEDHVVIADEGGKVTVEVEAGNKVALAFKGVKAAIHQNHGLLTASRHSIEAAAFWFIALERCCQQQLMIDACGHAPKLVPPDKARYSREHVGSEYIGWLHFQPIWEQLLKTQPDMLT